MDIQTDEKGGKRNIVIRSRGKIGTWDIDSLTKTGKKITKIEEKDGVVKIWADDKLVRTMNIDSLRKNARKMVYTYHVNGQNHKSFDSLKNTKEYKKRMKEYEKAREEYQKAQEEYRKMMQEYRKNLREQRPSKDKSGIIRKGEGDYLVKVDMKRIEAEMDRVAADIARNAADIERNAADISREFAEDVQHVFAKVEGTHEPHRINNVSSTLSKALKDDQLITGENFRVKFTSKGMLLNDKEQPQDVYEKYKKLLKDKNGVDLTEMLKDKDSMFVISN